MNWKLEGCAVVPLFKISLSLVYTPSSSKYILPNRMKKVEERMNNTFLHSSSQSYIDISLIAMGDEYDLFRLLIFSQI